MVTFMSGCANYTYNHEFISLDKNDFYKKVDNLSVCVVESHQLVVKRPRDSELPFVMSMEIDLNYIDSKIIDTSMKQYFSKVKFAKKCNDEDLELRMNIPKFKFLFENFTGVGYIYYTAEINVKYKGREILNNTYEIEDNDKFIWKWEFVEGKTDRISELYHKSLFNLFETKIKKDMLNAL